MDCRTARILLEFRRPSADDFAAEDAQALDSHLADCPECGSVARFERVLDQKIARAMQAVPVPAGLHQRLAQQFGRKPAWYRSRALQGLAAAAVVLLAVGLSVGFWSQQRIVVTPADIAQTLPRSAKDADKWLVQHGARADEVAAPLRFRYELLTWIGFTEIQGRKVPVLVFSNDNHSVRVHLLSRRHFDLDALARTPFNPSTTRVEIEPDLPCAHAIEYTGDLHQFLEREQPGA